MAKKIGMILVERGVLDADQQTAALDYAKRCGIPFGRACVKMGFVDEGTIVQALAAQMGAPSVSLKGVAPSPDVLAKLNAEQAETYRAIPVSIISGPGRGTLVVAVSSQKSIQELDEIAFATGHRVSPVIASDSDIDDALLRLYGRDANRHTRSNQMVDLELEHAQDGGDLDVVHDPLRLALDFLPVVSITRS